MSKNKVEVSIKTHYKAICSNDWLVKSRNSRMNLLQGEQLHERSSYALFGKVI